MMPATNLIFWSGIAVFSLAVLIIFWALLFDRVRRFGKPRIKRCPHCWYVMENIDHLTCPECGHTAKRERRLYLSRRRWRLAVAGLFLALIGAAGSFYPRLNTLTWIPHTPSWILINLIQDVGPSPDTVWRISYPAGQSWRSPAALPTVSQQIADELWVRYADGRLPL